MRFKSFEFENFKGIQEARLDLEVRGTRPRIFTLVGLNESGKTTILDAIYNFIPSRDETSVTPRTLDEEVFDASDLIPIAKKANFNGSVNIKAILQLDDTDVVAIRRELKKRDQYQMNSISDEISVRVSYNFTNSKFTERKTYWGPLKASGKGERARIYKPIQSPSKEWRTIIDVVNSRIPKIWYFPNFLFDFPQRVLLNPAEASDESRTNRLYRDLFQDILHATDVTLDMQTHVIERALSDDVGDHRLLDQLVLNLGREVTKSVVSAWNDMFASKELTDKKVVLKWIVEDGEIYLEFLLEDNDGIFAIKDRSLGFRWFFVYLLLTTYRGQRRSNTSDMVFLFDEPASNLHSSAQAMLLQSLERLAQTSDIIYTTHSPHLINPTWLNSTYVVENRAVIEMNGTSAATISTHTDIALDRYANFAAQNPKRRDYFQPVLDVLDYQPSKLELVPDVVMVEGKGDYQLLRYAKEVLLPSQPGDEKLYLLPGTGSGSLTQMIQLYVGWSRNFIVLLDGDSAGKSAKTKYIALFGEWISPLIFTLSEVSEDATVTAAESLLTRETRLSVEQSAKDDVVRTTKKGFQTAVEYLLALRKPVELDDVSQNRLQNVISALEKTLRDIAVERGSEL
ncbi:ATP-dependent endonuclease [Paenarthrobacter sp. NPDC057981]|uniref:ATP-dependent nuclease n=1 Tax=Paenarthrobacter sp. NPDC057981 TaxID=3346297 RepID=UPI0036DF0534